MKQKMQPHNVVALLLCVAQAFIFAILLPAYAKDPATTPAQSDRCVSVASDKSAPGPTPDLAVVIRSKLAEPDLRKGAHEDDLVALAAFYENRCGELLWVSGISLSAKGQQALFELEKADDWGLDKDAFDLPSSVDLSAGSEEQAVTDIRLNLAILTYARFARGGRFEPAEVSRKIYQTPPVLDPNTVLTEIAAVGAPDAYLRSLHPTHDQFLRLREALLIAREAATGENEIKQQDIKRILINMERWRWMPRDLGRVHVWSNTPEFMLYVVKEGKTVHADKTQVGTIRYATPTISDNMTAVVFNPEWIAPPTVLREDLLPLLRREKYAKLKKRGFSVSYRGKAVNPAKVDWDKANILAYTFIQKPGPHSNIGKVKFRLPNKYAFILHDTWPARRKYYQKSIRAIGRDCVRMEKPDLLAKVVLAEGNQLPASEVEDLWDNGINSRVALDTEIPVHSTYFTVVVDKSGKVSTYPDLYGLDHKLARVMFGDAKGFPMPTPEVKQRRAVSKSVRWKPPGSDVTRALQGFPSK